MKKATVMAPKATMHATAASPAAMMAAIATELLREPLLVSLMEELLI